MRHPNPPSGSGRPQRLLLPQMPAMTRGDSTSRSDGAAAWNPDGPRSLQRTRVKRWAVGLALVILGGHAVPSAEGAGGITEGPEIRRDATVLAVEKVLPSVVSIGTLTVERADPYEQMLRECFGYGRRAPDTVYSGGSGVVIDEEGWVLTNFHVVRDASEVRVTLANAPGEA